MKKLFLIFILIITSSCKITIREKPNFSDFDYSDFESVHLNYFELFSVQKPHYFAYIYSKWCGHCQNIKYKVFEFLYYHFEEFYFIEYSSVIPIVEDVSNTIGVDKIEDVKILGTPTMLMIENGTLAINIAGENAILNFMNEI